MKIFTKTLLFTSVFIMIGTPTNANLADPGEFTFHAQIHKSGYFRCGGAILSPYHVLTAATCLENYPAERITVTAGTNEFREEHGDSKMSTSFEQTRQAEGYVYHPSFVTGCDFVNNLGIIYLKEPFVFNSHVNAISLPDEQQELYLESAVRVGFGIKGDSNSPHLKKLEVDFSDEEPCNNLTSKFWGRSFRKNELCGKSNFQSVNVCVMDAGAPIICKWSSSSTPFLCGLDALTYNLEQCENEAYGITNNIQEHLPFILDVLEYTTFRLKCDENHFYCPSSHTCLPRSFICNGIKDCEGGEDETRFCMWEKPCPNGRFRCNDGRCILLKNRCDGVNNCESNDNDFLTPDEEKCRKETEGVNCPEGLHSCGAGDRCISADWRCDGVKDCKDGSDEEQCNDAEATQSSGIISGKPEKIRNNWVLYGEGYFDNDYEKEEICGRKPLPRGYVWAPIMTF